MEQLAGQMYMPTRMYPTFAWEALLTAPLVMLLGTQLAALIPSWRVRRLVPSEALRGAA
jgi:ABC-type lipoprotein release transport system permease subunit